ncbi:glycoside hydrolase family 43 protein [Saccharopolyspora mangrovi]|uniref:Glycoside hydrolase family 43 protein n=1 Tax=Saccharopolyspora mangrovi TaxID=3082379 RepID=A0ABU6ABT3_9PSEU|nr:glycoside hydrolase family 43 protein [Saccharopolyspora sp. S2-29]MEB3368926.1 glycoside hydrolase family 43 protein [Saccharopolyspora sp. S2-29]
MQARISRRTALAAGALALGATALPATAGAAAPRYANPLIRQRADPHITRHTDGSYYYTATVPEYDRLILRRARTIQGLADADEAVVWRKHETGPMGAHIWAPELHHVDGRWYLYFAAGDAEDVWRIRMYVLENSAADPFTGAWVEKGQIATAWDDFSLDATTFVHGGTRYLAWAQREPGIDSNSNLYLAPLSNPWTLTGAPVRLSQPTYEWETRGYKVNEGPSVIQRNGRVFLAYSASATDANYCLGLLTASADADLMDPAAWTKSAEPVFTSSEANSQYGPGHNSFTVAEDGSTDLLVYHARQYREIDGDPLLDPNRHTRVQPLGWKPDGTPAFATPVPDSH